jgi:hypothetical protein
VFLSRRRPHIRQGLPNPVKTASRHDDIFAMNSPISVQVKKRSPMTAAQRQRECRAGGKGRHRGGSTKQDRERARVLVRELLAAAEAAHAMSTAQDTAASPPAQPAAQADVNSIAA